MHLVLQAIVPARPTFPPHIALAVSAWPAPTRPAEGRPHEHKRSDNTVLTECAHAEDPRPREQAEAIILVVALACIHAAQRNPDAWASTPRSFFERPHKMLTPVRAKPRLRDRAETLHSYHWPIKWQHC